jgi:hypothetical protein
MEPDADLDAKLVGSEHERGRLREVPDNQRGRGLPSLPRGTRVCARSAQAIMTARFSSRDMVRQAPISARVLRQPMHSPAARSRTQTLTQGDAIGGSISSVMGKAYQSVQARTKPGLVIRFGIK